MAGDFLSEDEFSDVSDDDDENGGKKKRRKYDKKRGGGKEKKKKRDYSNPEEMSDSDDEDDKKKKDELEVQFTADGLMYVDKDGKVVGKVGDEKEEEEESDGEEEETSSDGDDDESEASDNHLGASDDEASAANASDSEDEDNDNASSPPIELKKGMAVQGNYHATEQYMGKANWYNGTITAVHKKKGVLKYDVTYEDGDFEDNIVANNVRPMPKSKEEKKVESVERNDKLMAKKKKLKAKIRAK